MAHLQTGKADLFSQLIHQFLEYFQDNFLRIGNIPEKNLGGHSQSVKTVQFAMDDEIVCSGSNDGSVKY